MRGHEPPSSQPAMVSNQSTDRAPTLPPIGAQNNEQNNTSTTSGPQLPPLSFGGSSSPQPPLSFAGSVSPQPPQEKKQLSAITERSSFHTNGRTPPTDEDTGNPLHNETKPTQATPSYESPVFNRPLASSPVPASPPRSIDQASSQPSNADIGPVRLSFDVPNRLPPRFEANVPANANSNRPFEGASSSGATNPAHVQLPLSLAPEAQPYYSSPEPAPEPGSEPRPRTASVLTSPHSDTQSYHSPPELAPGHELPRRTASVLTSPHSDTQSYHSRPEPTPAHEPPRRTASVLTSPHSIASSDDPSPRHLSDRASDRASVLTSPHSPHGILQNRELPGRFVSRVPVSPVQSQQTPPTAARVPSSPPASQSKEESNNIYDEAGALFYMQQIEPESNNSQGQQHRRVPTTIAEQDDDSSSSSRYDSSQPTTLHLGASSPNSGKGSRSPPVRQSTPMAFVERSSPKASNSATSIPADRLSPSSRPGLGRKPSGARAQATRSYGGDGISSSHQLTEEEETQSEGHTDSTRNHMAQVQAQPSTSSEDPNLDALAALSYLDADEEKPPSPRQAKVEPLNVRSANKAPSPPPQVAQGATSQFKSSFAPSKQAAERKAKAQAQQAAHHAAVHKPGRSRSKRKSKIAGAWNESSDEEEEEEEDDDDDDEVDSDGERMPNRQANSSGVASSNNSLQHRQNQAQFSEMNLDASQGYSHLRPPRTLPQIPANQNNCTLNLIIF